jgi:predicted nucleic acid-binding protein
MILDTSFLVALDAGESGARATAGELEASDAPLRIPTMAVQELYVAVGLGANAGDNARKFESLLANKPVVPLSDSIARKAGVLEGEHIASDAKPDLGPADAVVAATGLEHNEAVVTTDASDFETVDGLDVLTP